MRSVCTTTRNLGSIDGHLPFQRVRCNILVLERCIGSRQHCCVPRRNTTEEQKYEEQKYDRKKVTASDAFLSFFFFFFACSLVLPVHCSFRRHCRAQKLTEVPTLCRNAPQTQSNLGSEKVALHDYRARGALFQRAYLLEHRLFFMDLFCIQYFRGVPSVRGVGCAVCKENEAGTMRSNGRHLRNSTFDVVH